MFAGWRQRSPRPVLAPELWVAGALFLAFVGLIFVAYPAFFSTILPVATSVYIPDRRSLMLLVTVRAALLFAGVLVLALLGFGRRIIGNSLLGAMVAAGLGFAVAYLIQGKGYGYQIMPGVAMLATAALLAFSERAGARSRIDGVLPVVAAALLAVLPMVQDVGLWTARTPLRQALAPYGPGLRIVNITPDLTATSPLHRLLQAELVNSPPGLLMSLSAYRLRHETQPGAEALARIDAVELAERGTLREDIKRRPPDLIVTTRDGFDWLEWARQDPELSVLLAGYVDIGEVPFDGYALRLLTRPGLDVQSASN